MSHTVIGIFQSASQAREASIHLLSNGFDESDVDLATSHLDEVDNNNHRNASDDGIADFFRGVFGDDTRKASTHTEAGRNGAIVTVMAKTAEDAYLVSQILDNYGALEVNEEGETRTGSHENHYGKDGSSSIPVIEEELHIGKEEVDNGSIRIRSRIIEKPIEKTLRLRSEKITVSRNDVNRPATEEELKNLKEGTIEVSAHKEVPVVSKDARVVEEINVEKSTEEHEEIIRDSVKKTQVETEDVNDRRDGRHSDY
jgi:stress response protein YsnF